MQAPYDPVTGKNTIDMRRFLHGGEPRLTTELARELDRRREIIEREFRCNWHTVMGRYLAGNWLPAPGSGCNCTCYPHTAPIRSQRLMTSPDGKLVLVHIDETVHNSGEVTTWTEEIT